MNDKKDDSNVGLPLMGKPGNKGTLVFASV